MKGFLAAHYSGLTILLLASALVILFNGCKKNETDPVPDNTKTLDNIVVSNAFTWATNSDVLFSITAQDNLGNPIQGVRFNVYTAQPDSGGVYICGGFTDASGVWSDTHPLPTALTQITIANNYVGLIKDQQLPIVGNTVTALFGGVAPVPVRTKSTRGVYESSLAGVYYMGTYNSQGVPDYLEPDNDPVEQEFLNDLNATLPEQQPVPTYHPEYLATTVPDNLQLDELCDVWVTYITEGAGWRNAIGFFTFSTNDPPTSASEIDSIKIVFPNLSNAGSNGGLYPGNKVYIGRHPAGKSIGWVVFANGWNGTEVGNGNYRLYSIKELNPEPNPTLKKHTLLLRDGGRQSILFSFEDIRRDASSDQDFNDGVLYVKSNPVSAINTDGMPPITTTIPDTDGDGVPDNTDDYPTDPTKAFNNWYPSVSGYSTLAFEDLWPGKGDYDFNDLVLSYRFNQITNAQNKAVQVKATIISEAMGASLHNAFAFQMPITPAQVTSVTGIDLRHGLITVGANNTETGQSKAVVVVYDDAYDHLPPPGSGIGTNTEPGTPYVTPDTMQLTIDLAEPIALSEIGTPPYNPFIIVNQNRNREVHLPNQPPTDKVDGSDFGTSWDDSQPAIGRYYKTATNLPWALNITEKFNYVIERAAINTGYLKFIPWAESSGTTYADWYTNQSGYRDASKIYTHP